jgi:hypothetical protein
MNGRRVAHRVALAGRAEKCGSDAGGALALVTKVFHCPCCLSLLPRGGVGWRERGAGGGYLTEVVMWCGSGGERRIASRGALLTTPVITSPFVTNDWCYEAAQ